MSELACHYTKILNLGGILRDGVLLPSPPLACYGLSREAVEANPGEYGFLVTKPFGRRYFFKDNIRDQRGLPGWLSMAGWHEGEWFAVPLSRAGWCNSALGYLPPGKADLGWAFRLVIDLAGLDVFAWEQYQSRTNVLGACRRKLGEDSRQMGDDPADWLFVLGSIPLERHLVGLEQYHQGRWTSFDDVADRLPLQELYHEPADGKRPCFRARFIRASAGRVRASLFDMVFRDNGQWVADHVWVRQTWDHLRPGDVVEFYASVLPYTREDGTATYTLADVNGLVVLS
jgi:hypothetical protein